MIDSNAERARIVERHATYIRERMQLPISDRQYLWWDHIFLEKMPEALELYHTLIFDRASYTKRECFELGDLPRVKVSFQGVKLRAYRFTYAVATVLPLSTKDIMRHECNNPYCINPRHLMTGDQRENFGDLVATRAYGTRWKLLKGWHD